MWTLWLAASFQSDPWQQVGIGALIAAPAYAAAWTLWRELQASRKREREVLERTTPLLAETAAVIAEVQRKAERERETDFAQALSKVEQLAERLERR